MPSKNTTLYSTRPSKLNTLTTPPSLKLNLAKGRPLLGGVLWQPSQSYLKELGGALAMECELTFGKISGSPPPPLAYRVVCPRNELHLDNGDLVSCLIDHDLHVWKIEVVRSTFLPYQAEIILGIPLSALPIKDRQIWSTTSNSDFSVRSAYRIAHNL